MSVMRAPRRRALRQLTALLLLPAALVTAACDPAALTSVGGSPSQVRVALLVPTGAANPNVATLGGDLSRAAAMAVADSGNKVILSTYSTAGTESQAVAVAQQALAEGADVIVGPLYGGASNAVARAVAAQGKAVVSFSNNTDIAGGNLFAFGHSAQNTANQLGSYAASNGKRRVLVVNGRVPQEEVFRNQAIQGLSGTGVTVVGSTSFDFSEEGVNTAVPNIAEQVRTTGAEAVLLTSDIEGALPVLTNRMHGVGITASGTQLLGLTQWNSLPSALSLPGLQGGWFALPDPQGTQSFAARYAAANGGRTAHPLAVLAYDAINAMAVQAGKRGPAGVTPSGLVSAGSFAGAAGPFRFQSNGTVRRGMAIATIQNNSVRILKSAPTRLGSTGS